VDETVGMAFHPPGNVICATLSGFETWLSRHLAFCHGLLEFQREAPALLPVEAGIPLEWGVAVSQRAVLFPSRKGLHYWPFSEEAPN
jgi:hypothetical protein